MSVEPKSKPPRSVPPPPPSDPPLALGVAGYAYEDLFNPSRLRDLHEEFDRWFALHAADDYARFDAYRKCKGQGMTPLAISEALLAASPHVGAFLAKLFRVEAETDQHREEVLAADPVWKLKREFIKKRVVKE